MNEQDLKKAVNNIKLTNEAKNRILQKSNGYRKDEKVMKSKKKFIPIAVAATLVLGITVFAGTSNWSKGFLQNMNISKTQMNKLQNSNSSLVAMPNVSDTQNGITVSAEQCLFDGNSIHISFYVDGYELEKNQEPDLDYVEIMIDGNEVHNYAFSFFNGIDWSDREHPVMADGSPVIEDENGNYFENFLTADGKMEINLDIIPVGENGKLLSEEEFKNKEIAVIMHNFGNTDGTWTLKWNLGDFEKGKKFKIENPLGDTGAVIKSAVMYPASIIIHCDFPITEIQDTGIDENGNSITYTDFKEPPEFVGIRTKDGTLYTDLFNGGSIGYEDENSNDVVYRVSLSRIIDIDDVDALLFIKAKDYEHVSKLTEDDLYIVKIR